MEPKEFDVLIIGAGAAGLIAALEIALTGRNVAIIEARERIGGRAHSLNLPQFDLPVEQGAEFVHGDLKLTHQLLKDAEASLYEVKGRIFQKSGDGIEQQKDFIQDYQTLIRKLKELQYDISIAQFIREHLSEEKFADTKTSLQQYVEGYYAADPEKSSCFALREELTQSDDQQYRIENGYTILFDHLRKRIEKTGAEIYLSQKVEDVIWGERQVKIKTSEEWFSGSKCLITVPLGVLQSGDIRFLPSIPEYREAALQLGFGSVIKTMLQFHEAFWTQEKFKANNDLKKLSFIFSEAEIPTWWTYYPKDIPMLTGWSGGPNADRLKELSNKEIVVKAIASLAFIFDEPVSFIERQLKAWHVANWPKDPFCKGGYSYEVVGGRKFREILKQPLLDTIYFAGEGLHEGPEIGTVEAALVSGRDAAHRLIASFKN